MAIARLTGKPLVTHIHSTEFDRSGEHVNQRVYDIERRGMHAAIKIVAVSMLTKKICVSRYGLEESKIEVVYNGIESNGQTDLVKKIEQRDKIDYQYCDSVNKFRASLRKQDEQIADLQAKLAEALPALKYIASTHSIADPKEQRQRAREALGKIQAVKETT